MSALLIEAVDKSFGATVVLSGIDLAVAPGEIVALLGPSGCGKTTLLRIVAGLERPDQGRVHLGGELVADARTHLPPERREVGLVFQDFALFPHLDVADNLAFGLARRDPRARRQAVDAMLARFSLAPLARRYPHELSGGQQQRVALVRALIAEPRVLLMDEPFSNLDASLRRSLRVELRATLDAIGVATIFVTHDQDEALSLADRVAVMDHGKIAQLAPPPIIYRAPASLAVARATGQVVTLAGVAERDRLTTVLGTHPGHGPAGPALALIRPEQLAPRGPSDPPGPIGHVVGRDYTGPELELFVRLGDEALTLRIPLHDRPDARWAIGEPIEITVRGPLHWIAHA